MLSTIRKNQRLLNYLLLTIFNLVSLITVGFIWGATNPFIRLGSQGIDKIETGSKFENILQEIRLIGSRLNYWIPFLLNQLGSVLYVYTLKSASISAAVPIANSSSFVFTAVVGYLIGEKIPRKNVILGTIFVSLGTSLIIYDKLSEEKTKTINLDFYSR